MGSIYGVAWPQANPFSRTGGSNQTCTAGNDTVVMTWNNLAAPFAGFYFPVLWGNLPLQCGATAPSAIAVKASVNGGAAFISFNVWNLLLVNNAVINFPLFINGANSGSLWYPGPNTLTLSVNPTGQNVSYVDGPAVARVFLFRGNDS